MLNNYVIIECVCVRTSIPKSSNLTGKCWKEQKNNIVWQGGGGAAFLLGEGETVSANFEMDGFLHTLFLGTETQTEAEMFTTVFL